MEMVAAELTPSNHAVAVELASLPAQIRGYGHIKEANVEKVRALEPLVLKKFQDAKTAREAAVLPNVQNACHRTKRPERKKWSKRKEKSRERKESVRTYGTRLSPGQ